MSTWGEACCCSHELRCATGPNDDRNLCEGHRRRKSQRRKGYFTASELFGKASPVNDATLTVLII